MTKFLLPLPIERVFDSLKARSLSYRFSEKKYYRALKAALNRRRWLRSPEGTTDFMSGNRSSAKSSSFEKVHRWVRRIPPGKVMNYGQIASLLDPPLSARAVGWAMRNCPDDVPWHRVVNASGGCSTDRLSHLPQGTQKALLKAEGVRFDADGNVDMECCRWRPEA